MRYDNPQLQEALASAYVAGALQGPARRRFEALMHTRPALRRRVEAWEDRLTPLSDATPAVQPPARVWRAIQARVAPETGAEAKVVGRHATRPRGGLWNSLAFWRPFGALATGLAVLAIVFAGPLSERLGQAPAPTSPTAPQQVAPSYVAVLEDQSREPVMVVTAFRGPWRVIVEPLRDLTPYEGKVYQVWAVARDGGAIRPLLQISGSEVLHQPLGDTGWDAIKTSESLIVTQEDAGTSPAAPSGPAIYSGLCLNLKGPTET